MLGTKVGTPDAKEMLLCALALGKEAKFFIDTLELAKDAYENKNATEAVRAIIGAVTFMRGLKEAIAVCPFHEKTLDWTTFDEITQTLRNPIKTLHIAGQNIIFNGEAVTEGMKGAMEAMHNGEMLSFGQIVGSTLKDTCDSSPKDLFLY